MAVRVLEPAHEHNNSPNKQRKERKEKGKKMLALGTWWALRKLAAVIIRVDEDF